jgi:hypothetical protein
MAEEQVLKQAVEPMAIIGMGERASFLRCDLIYLNIY